MLPVLLARRLARNPTLARRLPRNLRISRSNGFTLLSRLPPGPVPRESEACRSRQLWAGLGEVLATNLGWARLDSALAGSSRALAGLGSGLGLA